MYLLAIGIQFPEIRQVPVFHYNGGRCVFGCRYSCSDLCIYRECLCPRIVRRHIKLKGDRAFEYQPGTVCIIRETQAIAEAAL